MKSLNGHHGTTGFFPSVVAHNDTVSGDKNGFNWEANSINDVIGFLQALLNFASVTPSGVCEVYNASDLLDSLKLGFINGLEGGTYTPSALLTWNNQLVVDASAAPSGTNLDGITVTGKGTGKGIKAYGGPGGVGGEFHAGNKTGQNAVVGIWVVGANALSGNYAGGAAVYGAGGEGFGNGLGGAGVFGRGGQGGAGNYHGVGGEFLGYGASWTDPTYGEGLIAVGASGAVGAIIKAGTGAANLYLVPRTEPSTGKFGDFYCDSAGCLFRCSVEGTPATWKKLADT